jgi:hypothetical protein
MALGDNPAQDPIKVSPRRPQRLRQLVVLSVQSLYFGVHGGFGPGFA